MVSFPIYEDVYKKSSYKSLTIDELIRTISQNKTLMSRTEAARKLYQPGESKGGQEYSNFKNKCESFIPAGTFKPGNRKDASLVQHSGFVVVDVDDIPEDLISDTRNTANLLTHTYLSFTSLSGYGVKILTPVKPVPQNAEEHRHAWRTANKIYETAIQFPVDPSGKNVSRLCVLTHDSYVYYNANAEPIEWEMPKVVKAKKQNVVSDSDSIDLSVLDFIPPDEFQTWLEVGMALKHESKGFDIWDNWSKGSSKYDNNDREYEKRWDSFNKGNDRQVTWGTIVKYARDNGYLPEPPKPRTPRKDKPSHETVDDPTQTIIHTDNWNADRFFNTYGTDVRFCTDWGKWVIWNRKQWKVDKTIDIFKYGRQIVKDMYNEAIAIVDEDSRKTYLKHAVKSDSKIAISNFLDISRSLVACTNDDFDSPVTKSLFNVQNGTVNLVNGNLTRHTQDHYITKISPVEYHKEAECPKWFDFLNTIFDDDSDMISFIQRGLGYSATADISEQCLFILYGTGSNGKSVMLETVMRVFGDYAMAAAPEMLIQKRQEDHPTSIADLNGKRFVTTIETGENRSLNETKVKMLTGGERIKARFMRKDFFEFQPTHKLWMATNHKPNIRNQDEGIWRRIYLIPFEVTIPDEKKIQFEVMLNLLYEERNGIFRWILDGAKTWKKHGLMPPDRVVQATKEYRNESDVLNEFFDECCVIDEDSIVASADLYRIYTIWCDKNGERKFTRRQLAARMVKQGYVNAKRRIGGKPLSSWGGIGLLNIEYNNDQDEGDVKF